jgi:predicted O-methyltransferase YrrM
MTLEQQLINKWWERIRGDVPTWTEPHNLCFCAEEASKAALGVELGTYLGASARAMLMANPNLHLWCVDKFDLVFGLEWAAGQTLRPWIADGRCELINGDSARGGQMLAHLKGKLDFVFVDDGHATEDVLRDIRWFYPLLRPGGVMFGHDFDVPHNDVAQGVVQSGIKFDIPVGRMWRSFKE